MAKRVAAWLALVLTAAGPALAQPTPDEDGLPLDLRGTATTPGTSSPRTPEEFDPDLTAGVAVAHWLAKLKFGADGRFGWEGGSTDRLLEGVRLSVVTAGAEVRLDAETDGTDLTRVGYRLGFDRLVGKRVPIVLRWTGERDRRPDGTVVHRTDGDASIGARLDERHEVLFHLLVLAEPDASTTIERVRAVVVRTGGSPPTGHDWRHMAGGAPVEGSVYASAESVPVFVGIERRRVDGEGGTRVVAGSGDHLRLSSNDGYFQMRARVEVGAGVRDRPTANVPHTGSAGVAGALEVGIADRTFGWGASLEAGLGVDWEGLHFGGSDATVSQARVVLKGRFELAPGATLSPSLAWRGLRSTLHGDAARVSRLEVGAALELDDRWRVGVTGGVSTSTDPTRGTRETRPFVGVSVGIRLR